MAEPLVVLVAGFLNSPHVTAWAEAVKAAGHEVQLTGRDAPHLPPSAPAANVHPLRADGLPLLRSLRMSHGLAQVASRIRPHVIHAHWLPEFGWMAAREGLRPLVCSAWGSDVLRSRGLGRLRSMRALQGAELVFADSEHLARATRELANVRVEVVRWGLDLDAYSPGDRAAARKALELDPVAPLVASVRGLDQIHNIPLLLEAFARVRARRPDVRLLLKTPDRHLPAEVKASLERLALRDAVTLLGNVPADRMPDVYRAADVVVSVPSSDSSPRSVWEALACGRPVVVSDLLWAREELEDGRTALLVKLEADPVAAAIERALDDGSLGAAGRALVEKVLDPAECSARIDALYRSIVRGVA